MQLYATSDFSRQARLHFLKFLVDQDFARA